LPSFTFLISLSARASEVLAGETEVLTSEDCAGAKFLLDAENLVVFGQTVGTAGSAGLDLASAETANKIADKVILSFSTAVGDHNTPASSLGHVRGFDGLSDGTDLVDLKEEGVAELLVNSGLYALRVGDEKIVANNLDALVETLGHLDVGAEVVLVEGIFNGNDGVVRGEVVVDVEEGIGSDNSIVGASLL